MPTSHVAYRILSGFLITVAASGFAQSAVASPSTSRPQTLTPARAPIVQQSQTLPIYRFTKPTVSGDGTSQLSQRFSAIYKRQAPAQDDYIGKPRYSMVNPDTNSVLEQYGASGGFYAYNPSQAFGETNQGAVDKNRAKRLACNFLNAASLVPTNAFSPAQSCANERLDASIDFDVTEIHQTVQPANGPSVDKIIGAVVQVPLFIDTSKENYVPLSGPGGHLSLLFNGTENTQFSLDNDVSGLAAVAMPFYGRSYSFWKSAPQMSATDVKTQVTNGVRQMFPQGTINVPDALLSFYVEEAAVEQTILEPFYTFSGITVEDNGHTIVLRDVRIPAVMGGVGGFGPSISITAPTNGSRFEAGKPLTLTGNISGGTGPYTYEWRADDGTVLAQGTAASAGPISTTSSAMPAPSHDNLPAPLSLSLVVKDADGIERSATVSITPNLVPSVFLPLINRDPLPARGGSTTQRVIRPAAINYSFGSTAGSDYPPLGQGGADLPGVIPDVKGFRTGLANYGWSVGAGYNPAYENDWKDCSLGGKDCSYGMDRYDFAYYAGHGGAGGLSLPTTKNDTWVDGNETRFQQLRWVGFSSCQTLRAVPNDNSAPIRRWFSAFQGAHMLLGFNSNMADVAFGGPLIDNMRIPSFPIIGELPQLQRTIREAWVQTAFQLNAGKPAYIYAVGANGVNPENNKLPKASDPLMPRPFPVASYHWVWWYE